MKDNLGRTQSDKQVQIDPNYELVFKYFPNPREQYPQNSFEWSLYPNYRYKEVPIRHVQGIEEIINDYPGINKFKDELILIARIMTADVSFDVWDVSQQSTEDLDRALILLQQVFDAVDESIDNLKAIEFTTSKTGTIKITHHFLLESMFNAIQDDLQKNTLVKKRFSSLESKQLIRKREKAANKMKKEFAVQCVSCLTEAFGILTKSEALMITARLFFLAGLTLNIAGIKISIYSQLHNYAITPDQILTAMKKIYYSGLENQS